MSNQGNGRFDFSDDPLPPRSDPPINEVPYQVKHREWARSVIAGFLVLLLAAVVLLPLIRFTRDGTLQELKDILGLVLSPVVGLVSAMVGFYFGQKR